MEEYAEKGVNLCDFKRSENRLFPCKDLSVQKNALNRGVGSVSNT